MPEPDIEDFMWQEGAGGRKIVLGVDPDDNLYVNRKRVMVVEQELRLSRAQAVLGGIAAVLVALASAATIMDVYLTHRAWWDSIW